MGFLNCALYICRNRYLNKLYLKLLKQLCFLFKKKKQSLYDLERNFTYDIFFKQLHDNKQKLDFCAMFEIYFLHKNIFLIVTYLGLRGHFKSNSTILSLFFYVCKRRIILHTSYILIGLHLCLMFFCKLLFTYSRQP